MGFRDRLKKMKNRSGSNTPSSDNKSEHCQPGEEPKLKYRGKVEKEHADKLHAFSFSAAWRESRRKSATSSVQGTMSPGGTLVYSRRTSLIGSLRKRSVASGTGSDADGRDVRRKSLAQQPDTDTVAEENLLHEASVAHVPEHADVNTDAERRPLVEEKITNGVPNPSNSHDVPFPPEELHKALSRATAEAPAGIERGEEIAAH